MRNKKRASIPIRARQITFRVAYALIFCTTLQAQNILQHALDLSFRDMAEVKIKAEAGDPKAQCILANSLAANHKRADAFQWYSKAATQGNADAIYQVGHMLLFGATGIPKEQSVASEPVRGIQVMFHAATNRNVAAYYDLYRAYKDGIGVEKEPAQAFAWLQLHVNKTEVPLLGSPRKGELNTFALQLDAATLTTGKKFAALYSSGKWPVLAIKAPSPGEKSQRPSAKTPTQPAQPTLTPRLPSASELGLSLNGVANGKQPLAIINGKAVAVGESALVNAKPKPFNIKCLAVGDRTATILIQGESQPRTLNM